jgi:predicted exporter
VNRSRAFWIAAAALATFAGWFGFKTLPQLRIETNLLELLPVTERDRQELAAINLFAQRAGSELLHLVGSAENTRAVAAAFVAPLRESGAFASVAFEIDDSLLAAVRAERRERFAMLSERQRNLLVRGDTTALEREALQAAYTPLGLARPFGLAEDPLGLASDWLTSQAPSTGTARIESDFLATTADGKQFAIIRAQIAGDPYALGTQSRVLAALDRGRAAARAVDPAVDIVSSGVMLHAAAGAKTAQREVGLFGGAGLLAIIVLLVVTFRSARPLLLAIGSIAVAAATGVAACQAVFDHVHVLTLTFGTSLIGISVDYSLHYFTNRMRAGDEPASITPALLLGCGTTLIGYLALFAAPIPGLRQIALFSAVGLAVACACVVFMYPGLSGAASERTLPSWAARVAAAAPSRSVAGAIGLAAIAALSVGLARVTANDDVRALQRSPQALLDAEQRLRSILQLGFDTRFVLVAAPSAEELLQREEELAARLRGIVSNGALAGFLAVTQSLPSRARQFADRALLARHVYSADGALVRVMQSLGFAPSDIDSRRAEFSASEGRFLTPEQWLVSPASVAARHLWLGRVGDQYASVVLLRGLRDAEAVRAAAGATAGVRYVDQVSEITALLKHYRQVASVLLAVVLLLIAATLFARYRSAAALRIALPAIGSVLLTVALLGLIGVPLNLFHVLSLLLVLGMGVDYAVFLAEGRRAPAVMAVVLSAATTLLSFGLLGLSSVTFVRSIGLTVALGIAMALILSLVVRPRAIS